jgi:hypothetical protein
MVNTEGTESILGRLKINGMLVKELLGGEKVT